MSPEDQKRALQRKVDADPTNFIYVRQYISFLERTLLYNIDTGDIDDWATFVIMLKNGSKDDKIEALHILGATAHPASIPYILEATYNSDPDIAFPAIFALQKTKSESSIPRLIEVVKSSRNWTMRSPAITALAKISANMVKSGIDPDKIPAVSAIIEAMLKDPSSSVKSNAAFRLRNIGGNKAIEALTQVSNDRSQGSDLRVIAEHSLQKIRSKNA